MRGPGALALLQEQTVLSLDEESLRMSLTNCFFLSVQSRVISSLSALISSSLYWKSLTVNLCQDRNQCHLYNHTGSFELLGFVPCVLTCSLWLCA